MPSAASAYATEYEHFEKALADPKGIRIPFDKEGDAIQFRLRLHQARRLAREINREAFGRDHSMHGRSEYDGLVVRVKEGQDSTHFVYIERMSMGEVEALSEVEE